MPKALNLLHLLLPSILLALLAFYIPLPIPSTTTTTNETSTTNVNSANMSAAANAIKISRSIVKKVFAEETAEGVGARVRRTIGTRQLRNLSPFLMLDNFYVPPGPDGPGGFPDHAHRGQATVTYMLEGSFQHEDSVGNKGTIGPGDVQWMTAGKGIMHAEMPVHGPGLPVPCGLQLWVDLPKEHKMTAPTYQELSSKNIPTAYPEGPDGPAITIISGKSHGVESPVRPLGGCWYFDIKLKKAGQTVFQPIPEGWTSFIYSYKGAFKVADGPVNEKYYTLVLSSAENQTGVELTATEDDTQLFLIAGEPLDQPVVQYGPFVMTSNEEIQQTFMDYRLGQNGFENARTWKSEIGGQ